MKTIIENIIYLFHSKKVHFILPCTIVAGVLTYIWLDNFSEKNHKLISFQNSPASIILDYHKLYTQIESSDIYMSPVISARFLMSLNVVIHETVKASQSKEVTSIDYKYQPNLNQDLIQDTLFLATMLNAALSHHMVSMFQYRVRNSMPVVEKTYQKIQKQLQQKNSHNFTNFDNANFLGKLISETVAHNLLPADYVTYPKLTVRDSIYVNCYDDKNCSHLNNWVVSLLKYESIIDLLGIKVKDFPEKTTYKPKNEKELYSEALEIYTLSKPLKNEYKWIAEFWSDDLPGVTYSPTTRWINILNQIVENEKPDISQVLDLYFLVSLSMHETAVFCWPIKYETLQQRPSAFIKKYMDPTWHPFHQNPAFPGYPSGHAAFGKSACTVLEHFFGANYAFTDNSHKGNKAFLSNARSFLNFEEMAAENAKSRMYLGVHYRYECEDGLAIGYKIGKAILPIQYHKKTTITAENAALSSR